MRIAWLGLVFVVGLTGCTNDPASQGASSRSSSHSPTPSTTHSCAALLAADWAPPKDMLDFDMSHDPESGIVEFHFGNQTLRLDAYHDQDCDRLPVIGRVIKRIRTQSRSEDQQAAQG